MKMNLLGPKMKSVQIIGLHYVFVAICFSRCHTVCWAPSLNFEANKNRSNTSQRPPVTKFLIIHRPNKWALNSS